MRQILEELWNGNIRPCDLCGAGDAEIEELRGYIKRHKEELAHSLNGNQKKVFENYLVCYDEYLYLIAVSAFGEGFSLAAKLLKEAL